MTNSVNAQVTDAVTQTNVNVLAQSPAQALSLVYQTMAHSLSLSMQNTVMAQNQMQQMGAAIVSAACAKIMARKT